MSDRMVHAERVTEEGCRVELVRYDRQGRWYLEWDQPPGQRTRLKTVHEAVSAAVDIQDQGGTVHTDRPGGGRFDYMVAAAGRRKERTS